MYFFLLEKTLGDKAAGQSEEREVKGQELEERSSFQYL